MGNKTLSIHILALFPQSLESYLESSILKKAQTSGLFEYHLHNLAHWSVKNTRRVDDRPYGGGSGTIIGVEPLYNAIISLEQKYGDFDEIIYMSPTGKTINQEILEEEISKLPQKILIICGHYEGIDARIFELFTITELSIGDYILSSGELASLVLIDGLVRLIPGVLSQESLEEETFSQDIHRQGEYPQYTRPEVFHDISVPEVLVSGNHKKIKKWRQDNIRSLQ
ncbi:tRNA (guanosine(37)-N1)-methyltransferase TrmD [Candidatus Gracilibacteria bacterium]|nr:MAG: tRNA (guanosine(37)-N1)-methyltransferase TrmD [Candidatus Gracilibacteria bacterium]